MTYFFKVFYCNILISKDEWKLSYLLISINSDKTVSFPKGPVWAKCSSFNKVLVRTPRKRFQILSCGYCSTSRRVQQAAFWMWSCLRDCWGCPLHLRVPSNSAPCISRRPHQASQKGQFQPARTPVWPLPLSHRLQRNRCEPWVTVCL